MWTSARWTCRCCWTTGPRIPARRWSWSARSSNGSPAGCPPASRAASRCWDAMMDAGGQPSGEGADMSRLKLVAALAVVTALGGCSPLPSWAAKLTPTGLPQFVDTDCETLGVEWMQLQSTDDNGVVDEKDPVIWK